MVSLYIDVCRDWILNTRFTVLDSQIHNRLCGKKNLCIFVQTLTIQK